MGEKSIDNEKLKTYAEITKIAIIACWISLIGYWCIKLFGGNFFEIVVNNKNFIAFSKFLQNTWLKYISSLITIFIANYLTMCAICQKFTFKGKQLAIVIALILSMWIAVNFVNIEFVKMWYTYFILIVFGVVYQKGYKKCFGVVAIILDFLFSTISILTRNIELHIITDQLTLLILGIDIYIMFLLYYLYMNLLKIIKEIK